MVDSARSCTDILQLPYLIQGLSKVKPG
jgi:hypothetical protein